MLFIDTEETWDRSRDPNPAIAGTRTVETKQVYQTKSFWSSGIIHKPSLTYIKEGLF